MPWNEPFEQDGTRVYRMARQWTDRWTRGIAAMVPNEIHYQPKSFRWAIRIVLHRKANLSRPLYLVPVC